MGLLKAALARPIIGSIRTSGAEVEGLEAFGTPLKRRVGHRGGTDECCMTQCYGQV